MDALYSHPSGAQIIFWYPKAKDGDAAGAQRFINQTTVLNQCLAKKEPVGVFDLARSITEEEMKWMTSKGVRLFEPFIRTRRGFEFLSLPFESKELKMADFDKEPDVSYGVLEPTLDKAKSVTSYGDALLLSPADIGNVRILCLYDTEENYKYGYINPKVFEWMQKGALLVLPDRHIMFHSLFEGQIIKNEKDRAWFLNHYKSMSYGCAMDIKQRLMNSWDFLSPDYFREKLDSIK